MAAEIYFSIYRGIYMFLRVVNVIILAYCVMSWFVRPTNQLFMWVSRFAQVILAPFRPIAMWLIGKGLRMDVSPILALMAVNLIDGLLRQLLYLL